jgi:hypothetical protein
MHLDTCAALRQLVLALEEHPEDLKIMQVYGDMGEHLADLISDYLNEGP